eukprot:6450830-Pyramimonas_sp.AAC.1
MRRTSTDEDGAGNCAAPPARADFASSTRAQSDADESLTLALPRLRLRSRCTGPVSYTHLRAHETGAYL